ncbi:MAG: hypothetical protein BPH43C_11 [Phage 5P_1]|nr:MAG: hypothetical protein BPH43C_11 [Phage 5P_1]
MMSEFGTGLVYCLGLFLEHTHHHRNMGGSFNGGTRSREYATVNLLVGECRDFALEDIYHQYIVTEIPLQYISRLSMNSQKNYTRINEMMNGIHDGVVIIPDLETHVHSSRLEELCRMIYDAAKSRNNKVFASTDSYECIGYMFEACRGEMQLFRAESNRIVEYDPETIEAAIRMNLEVR